MRRTIINTYSQHFTKGLNLPLLFSASDSPRDENTINVGANRHIANMFRTKDVVTLEKMMV